MQDTTTDLSQVDEEISRLKNELSRTKNALTNQIFKRHQLVAELSLKVDRKNEQLKVSQRCNFDDLGRVLRSLYVFESRLRKEQQHIRRQLGERDSVIRQQQVEIAKLRQTLANRCHENDVRDDAADVSKPDLITSIQPSADSCCETDGVKRTVPPPPSPPSPPQTTATTKSEGPARKNVATPALPVGVDTARTKKNANNNVLNFNKNVYSKTVTDLSLNDISSFPNPTPNNNLFVVSNSIFSKNEFTYNEVSKEVITSVKQNGKVITSALKKADKYPSAKTVHFGKTTHIPEPDEDGQTDIVKTVETLLLQCGDSCTESENDTSSTASTETSPSVSQMVRKFESICTTATLTTSGDSKGSPPSARNSGGGGSGNNNNNNNNNGSYIADAELKTAAELSDDDASPTLLQPTRPISCCGAPQQQQHLQQHLQQPESDQNCVASLGDLDPRNNFEEFRFEDSDLDREYRPEADGLECPSAVSSAATLCAGVENCGGGGGGEGRVNYESFLEVTGLSQKSIITVVQSPCTNRNVYGSHRNVQKPKDVKSRSRAKSASFEYKTYPSAVKYWTEPFV